MVLLKGGTHYLLLSRDEKGRHEVACHESFSQAITDWTLTGTRISPLFSLNGAAAPKFIPHQTTWLWFCGPVHPSRVEKLPSIPAYLSLGLYNIVIHATTQDLRERVKQFVEVEQLAWEVWELRGREIVRVDYSSLLAKEPLLSKDLLKTLASTEPALTATVREYITLMAASLSRGARCTPAAARELLQFDDGFRRRLLQSNNKGNSVKQGLLATANAALSRYTSQTFAGTSPIIESECHYYTHSLLGIGTASLALTQIRRFVENAVVTTRLIDRVLRLKDRPAAPLMLQTLAPGNSFWNEDHLAGVFEDEDETQQRFEQSDDPRLHLLTYFSGRDGFRATVLSLSAPLELLHSCNSVLWTLLTITHEISHILVDGVLGFLLPKPHVPAEVIRTIGLLDSGSNVKSLFEQLQQLLCYTLWQMDSPDSEASLDADELRRILDKQLPDLYEIITHCFDFLYFYRGNAEIYIHAVWASWSVIPNIEHRISEYLMRSLCALFTLHVRREKGVDVTIDQLTILLEAVKNACPDAQYIPQAIEELKSRRSVYADALGKRRGLSVFVRHFLYSPGIEQQLTSPDATFVFKPLEFTPETVKNPLRFIHDFSKDPAANHIRSAWILQQLAFGGDV